MIETAAWVAFILGLVFLCESVFMLVRWILYSPENSEMAATSSYLMNSAQAAAAFVASALALGALACIDRYVFDVDEIA